MEFSLQIDVKDQKHLQELEYFLLIFDKSQFFPSYFSVLSGQQITIGKIYAAKLIYESFKEIKRRNNCTLPQFEVRENFDLFTIC